MENYFDISAGGRGVEQSGLLSGRQGVQLVIHDRCAVRNVLECVCRCFENETLELLEVLHSNGVGEAPFQEFNGDTSGLQRSSERVTPDIRSSQAAGLSWNAVDRQQRAIL